MEKKGLTAPCGLDCFNCDLYVENLTDKLSGLIQGKLGIPEHESDMIRKKYFTGKFVVGRGQDD